MQNKKDSNVDVSVIIPTYEEKDNIGILFDRISKCLNNIKYEIVVIDDNSPDGTAQIVESLSNNYPVKLIVRKKDKGLASAVVEGFRHSEGNIFIVMDADLQHPPEKMKTLIEEIYKGSDIVIASRYDGEFGEFSIFRTIVSKGANFIAKILFPKLSCIDDIQSGFFALKGDVVDGVGLNPVGYKILLEILILGKYKDVKEIGYKFGKRENGKSKLGIGTIIYYIYHLLYLSWRTKELNKPIKYCIVGLSGIVVNTFILFFFTDVLKIFYLLSSVIAYEVSILTNFIINDQWTFSSVIPGKSFLTRAMYFNYAMITGTVFGIIFLYIFTDLLSINYLMSNIISITIVFIWRYYASITMVWNN